MGDNVKFKIGDRLKASDYDREHHGLKYVTITSINNKTRVYHWEGKEHYFNGTIHSGYFFDEVELYVD